MSDLISRQDVIDLISINKEQEIKRSISADCKHKSVVRSKHDSNVAFCEYLIKCVEDIPPAEPKKGKWTIETIGEIPRYRDSSIYEPIYRCSCCGLTSESYIRFEEPYMPEDADFPNFCPNCGAEMEVTV